MRHRPLARRLVGFGERALPPLLLAILAAACGRSASRVSAISCDVPSDVVRPDTGTVVVRGEEAPCTIDFREVVTLRSRMEGKAARLPVALGPGGTYLTATYSPGELAVWSPSGELERTIGRGAGQGPGEFEHVQNLVVDTIRDRVYVLPGTPEYEVFTLEGAFQRRAGLPMRVLYRAVLASDGSLVGEFPRIEGPRQMRTFRAVIRADTVAWSGAPARSPFPFSALASSRDGFWTAEPYWYELDHRRMDGTIDFRIRREASWVTPHSERRIQTDNDPSDHGPLLMAAAVDEPRGLAFALLMVADPNAPEPPKPVKGPNGEFAIPKVKPPPGGYVDMVIEAFTLDGRLIASRRWDVAREAPDPITAERWYTILDDDLRSIRILRPVLVER